MHKQFNNYVYIGFGATDRTLAQDFAGLLGSGRRLFDLSTIVITIKTRSVDEAQTTAADLDVAWQGQVTAHACLIFVGHMFSHWGTTVC